MPIGPKFKTVKIDKNLPDPGKNQDDYYYTTKELSGFLNISESSLRGYRRTGNGPKFTTLGYRNCRYAKTDVLEYIAQRQRLSTSQNLQTNN